MHSELDKYREKKPSNHQDQTLNGEGRERERKRERTTTIGIERENVADHYF